MVKYECFMTFWLSRYRLLENITAEILYDDKYYILTSSPTPSADPEARCHGMKANPTGFLWSKYECFLISGCQDIDF